MKILLTLSLIAFVSEVGAACGRPADPKKVVLMISFHDGAEEERGAREGACARGETLVVIPKPSAEYQRAKSELDANERRMGAIYEQQFRCQDDTCRQGFQPQIQSIRSARSQIRERLENLEAPDYKSQLNAFLQSSQRNGTKVSSLILSGHDGGGHYYGDYGDTDMAKVSQIVQSNQGAFANTSSLLLMGCWSATPDQVEQWRAIFPKMRVIGGFVGSAPSSTRTAAGTYISGLLRGERNLPRQASRAGVLAMINSVQHMNMVTSGVFVDPLCEPGRSPAYYYISPANDSDEIPDDMKVGLNLLSTQDSQKAACLRAFGGEDFRGTFDWNSVLQYYQGEREPENNAELRGLYSFLRNNQHCFDDGDTSSPVDPDQVLFLRFFQDTKKNFNKYFKSELETMYSNFDRLVAESTDPRVKTMYQEHKKLVGDSLIGMTRRETNQQISGLQGIYDRIYRSKTNGTEQDRQAMRQVIRSMQILDQHLYRLQCLPPTWHEYSEGETLAPPTC